jgi:hypothetical protein
MLGYKPAKWTQNCRAIQAFEDLLLVAVSL